MRKARRRQQRTKKTAADKVVVHLLYGGSTACGLMQGEDARSWPAGHLWVGPDNAIVVSCVVCQGVMKAETKWVKLIEKHKGAGA